MFAPLNDLETHAAERPDAVAIVSPTLRYTFAELAVAVDATAIRLRAEGVAPRQVVALDLPAALEWIIDLALMRLATRSVSVRGVSATGGLPLDVLVTSPGGRGAHAPGVLEVDERWIAGAVAAASGAAPLVDYPRPDSIFRLLLTSGTTGTPRAAAYSVAALEHRRLGLDHYWTDERPELDFMPLSTTGGFHTAIAALRHGQAFRAVDHINERTLRFAASEGVRVLAGSPAQLAAALTVLTEHDIALPALEEVRLAGATPSVALLRLIDTRLGVPVRSIYGSTEAGGVTMRMVRPDDDLANVGPALPSIELQVVDGAVRYRGPGMLSGYLVGGVVQPFAGGWFEPGDLGSLDEHGALILGGRASDVLNIGGVKVNPARIDDLAAEFAGVRDAAAFTLDRGTGRAELGLAVVADPDCDLAALDRMLRQQLRVGYPTTYWRVAEVPRNRMGKVERGAVAAAYARTLPG